MSSDRHKVPRVMESGAEKRKKSKEEESKRQNLLAKTRRITDFVTNTGTPSTSTQRTDIVVEVVDDGRVDQVMPEVMSETTESEKRNECELLHSADVPVIDGTPPPPHDVPIIDGTPVTLPYDVPAQVDKEDVISNDIGLWNVPLTQEHVDLWARKGSDDLQNCDDKLFELKSSKQHVTGQTWHRRCTIGMFERRNRNGEVVKRSWLCFSPADGRVYCFFCKLMAVSSTQLTENGYCDWKHASSRLCEHEISKDHLDAVVRVARRAKELGSIDRELAQQLNCEESYWRNVLKRLVSVIKFACERGLALHGGNETLGSPSNGNYLGMLELIAQYDNFLLQHIQKHANVARGHTNYLSAKICEELIEVMGKRVLNEITSRIKESRYYSVSLDSTPDESHVDQLTLVFRYMEKTKPVERFVKFMPNQGHKAQDMFDGLMKFLNAHSIDIRNCRGQSYDNAAAMSGRYNGLQAKVAQENNLAAWVPCAGKTLYYLLVLDDLGLLYKASENNIMIYNALKNKTVYLLKAQLNVIKA